MARIIILASSSGRRRELLMNVGLKFKAIPSNIKEDLDLPLTPRDLVQKIAWAKAETVAKKYKKAIVIGADTVVVRGKEIMGKPRTKEQAKEMLKKLSGKPHLVITGFSVIDSASGKRHSGAVETKVYFRKLTNSEIESYTRKEKLFDKAGSYAIQELGSLLVRKIEGDYFNIVGMPLSALAEALKKFGIFLL